MQFSSIQPIDKALSGATIPSQSGPGSNDNERVLRILQSLCITETLPSDCLVSYSGHSLAGILFLCLVQSVYSTSPAKWATIYLYVNK